MFKKKMANEKLFGITVLTIVLLWISCVCSQSCGIGCIDPLQCQPYHNCHTCRDGFYMDYNSENKWRCFQCPQWCRKCSRTDQSCSDCKDGYYMTNNKCAKCFEGCSKCVGNDYGCSHQCKPGRWGSTCQFSCISCSECVDERCKELCNDYEGTFICDTGNCPDQKCSFGFSGPRKSDTGTPLPTSTRRTLLPTTTKITLPPTTTRRTLPPTTTRRTSPPTSTRRTLPPTTTRRTLPPTSTRRTLPPTTTRRTLPPTTTRRTLPTTTRSTLPHTRTQRTTTSFTGHDTTTKQSESTTYSERPSKEARTNKDGITEQTESITDGIDPTVVYILIAVVGVLVLTVVAGIVVIVCIKRRNSRQDQMTCPQDANNKAESRQLTDNTGVYSNANNQNNAIGNVATINVAESDTGYVDMTTIDNIATINAAGSTKGNIDLNTIDTIASINIAGSNTEYVDLNSTAYVNVVDKPDVNATATVNAYEALNQYTNVRDVENQYTSLSGNENVYYSVPD